MCGIAGRVNKGGPVDPEQLLAMSERLTHRGPDDEGSWFEGTCGLVHRRLSIVNLAHGHQPVVQGRTVLVYNGEVYNHADLRPELEARGATFRTRCDTEAVLHAHEAWGPDAPARLRGMFAYAAWDRSARRLTLVRDRLGIKPVYYAHLPSGDLLFASELRALLAAPEVNRRIDEDALATYLALRYVPAPATILAGVKKLLPGAILVWQDGAIRVTRYWQVPTGDERDVPKPPPTVAEAGGRLCALLDEVVQLHRMADVPLGTFLSGGLDSTLVSAILVRMAREAGDPVPCSFSVGFLEAGPDDELAWAQRAAAALGTRHRELVISGEQVAAAAPRIIADLDEPLGDPAAVPLWFLSRRARAEVKIVLSGEGADEVFAGYRVYRRLALADRLRALPGAPALARAVARVAGPGRGRRAASLVAAPPEPRYRGVARAFDDDRNPIPGASAAVARALAPAWAHALRAPTPLARLLAFDQQVWLPDDLLVKADRTTMAHSLELRPPLLDHKLIEEVAAWPDDWKLDGGVGKAILRTAARGIVPDEILTRKKIGFGTPVAAWMRGALRPLLHDVLLARGGLAEERSARPLIDELLGEHERGADRHPELWTLLCLELWRREVAAAPAATTRHAAVSAGSGQ